MNETENKFPLFVLIYVITLTAVNAVLYTPALPKLTTIMSITSSQAQYTIAFFLVGYAAAQIVFGLLANYFGRKKSLLIGLNLGVAASFMCVAAVLMNNYKLLLFSRFLVGLGTASGLIITYAVVNDSFTGNKARKVTSYIVMAFAVAPGIANLIGGFLTELNPLDCFIFLLVYNAAALIMVIRTSSIKESSKISLCSKLIFYEYIKTFLRIEILIPALIYGCFGAILYTIVAIAPFIAMQNMHLTPQVFGAVFCLSYFGYLGGSYVNTLISHKITSFQAVFIGIVIAFTGETLILCMNLFNSTSPVMFFSSILVVMLSLPFIFVNTSVIAVSGHNNKSNASSVLNTVTVSTACAAVFICGEIKSNYCIDMISLLFILTMIALAIYIVSYSGLLNFSFSNNVRSMQAEKQN